MVWRRRVILTRSSRAASATATGARGATGAGAKAEAGAGAGGETCPAITARTSVFITRPSLPVAATASRDRLFSAISFLADGASSTSLAAGAATGFTLGAAAVSARAASVGFAAIAPSLIVASSAATPTVVPSAAMISANVPATGDGTSTVTLSVSSSHSMSSTATASPGFLNHVATVASVTLSPKVGTLISTLMGLFLRWSALRSQGLPVALCACWPTLSLARLMRRGRHRPRVCVWRWSGSAPIRYWVQ